VSDTRQTKEEVQNDTKTWRTRVPPALADDKNLAYLADAS
jgi:hypothetical protein